MLGIKELTVMAEDVEILRALAEKTLDELAEIQTVIDEALIEIRMS